MDNDIKTYGTTEKYTIQKRYLYEISSSYTEGDIRPKIFVKFICKLPLRGVLNKLVDKIFWKLEARENKWSLAFSGNIYWAKEKKIIYTRKIINSILSIERMLLKLF